MTNLFLCAPEEIASFRDRLKCLIEGGERQLRASIAESTQDLSFPRIEKRYVQSNGDVVLGCYRSLQCMDDREVLTRGIWQGQNRHNCFSEHETFAATGPDCTRTPARRGDLPTNQILRTRTVYGSSVRKSEAVNVIGTWEPAMLIRRLIDTVRMFRGRNREHTTMVQEPGQLVIRHTYLDAQPASVQSASTRPQPTLSAAMQGCGTIFFASNCQENSVPKCFDSEYQSIILNYICENMRRAIARKARDGARAAAADLPMHTDAGLLHESTLSTIHLCEAVEGRLFVLSSKGFSGKSSLCTCSILQSKQQPGNNDMEDWSQVSHSGLRRYLDKLEARLWSNCSSHIRCTVSEADIVAQNQSLYFDRRSAAMLSAKRQNAFWFDPEGPCEIEWGWQARAAKRANGEVLPLFALKLRIAAVRTSSCKSHAIANAFLGGATGIVFSNFVEDLCSRALTIHQSIGVQAAFVGRVDGQCKYQSGLHGWTSFSGKWTLGARAAAKNIRRRSCSTDTVADRTVRRLQETCSKRSRGLYPALSGVLPVKRANIAAAFAAAERDGNMHQERPDICDGKAALPHSCVEDLGLRSNVAVGGKRVVEILQMPKSARILASRIGRYACGKRERYPAITIVF